MNLRRASADDSVADVLCFELTYSNRLRYNMRIIGGVYRSRLIEMPRGVAIRPTQDKVREAVFNILANRIVGARVLDLYAGSGAFGLEALSRGAMKAVFVDSNPQCIRTIIRNAKNLDIEDAVVVLRDDSVKALKILESSQDKFDLVFLDPPYGRGIARKCLISLIGYDIVAPIHSIIAEHHKKDALGDFEGLIRTDERLYGDTAVSMFESRPR